MRSAVAVLGFLALAGCASYDRGALARIEPAGPGAYRFVATTDAAYPLHSERAERIRLDWLRQAVEENGACPRGYAVESRTPLLRARRLVDFHDVHYAVRCL